MLGGVAGWLRVGRRADRAGRRPPHRRRPGRRSPGSTRDALRCSSTTAPTTRSEPRPAPARTSAPLTPSPLSSGSPRRAGRRHRHRTSRTSPGIRHADPFPVRSPAPQVAFSPSAPAPCSRWPAARGPRPRRTTPYPPARSPRAGRRRARNSSIAVHTSQLQLADSGSGKKLPFTVSELAQSHRGTRCHPGIPGAFRRLGEQRRNPADPGAGHRRRRADRRRPDPQPPDLLLRHRAGLRHRLGAGLPRQEDRLLAGPGAGRGRAAGAEGGGVEELRRHLVPLPSTQFLTALQAGRWTSRRSASRRSPSTWSQYGKDGARGVHTDVVDLLSILWAPAEVIDDDAKAEAIRAYIPLWARGVVWAWENTDRWIASYYVKDQGVTDGRRPAHRRVAGQAAVPGQLGQGDRLGAADRRPDGRGRLRARGAGRTALRPAVRGPWRPKAVPAKYRVAS